MGHKAITRFVKTFLSTVGMPSQAPSCFKASNGQFISNGSGVLSLIPTYCG